MTKSKDQVVCETPTSGKKPTKIDKWKYDAVRKAILRVVPKRGDGVPFKELPLLVKGALSKPDLDNLGSVTWYVTTVKLDMEFRGELHRVAGAKPQRLVRA